MEKLADLRQRGAGIIPGRVRDHPIARGATDELPGVSVRLALAPST